MSIRIYYEDTDAGGIVYHANYLKYLERARSDWVRNLGIKQHALLEQSIAFVVIDMSIQFKGSAKLDDLIEVSCDLLMAKRASMLFEQVIKLNNKEIIKATVKVACVNTKFSKPMGIPTELFKAIKQVEGSV